MSLRDYLYEWPDKQVSVSARRSKKSSDAPRKLLGDLALSEWEDFDIDNIENLMGHLLDLSCDSLQDPIDAPPSHLRIRSERGLEMLTATTNMVVVNNAVRSIATYLDLSPYQWGFGQSIDREGVHPDL